MQIGFCQSQGTTACKWRGGLFCNSQVKSWFDLCSTQFAAPMRSFLSD